MPISSLVVTLDSNPSIMQRALLTLRAMPGVRIGEPCVTRVPVVVETATLVEGHRLVDHELRRIDGVLFIDVVRIDFEDMDGGTWNDDGFF